MTRLIHISILFLLTSNCLFAQDKNSLVKDIRSKYTEIRNNIDSYDTTMIDFYDESTEGAVAIAYCNNKELKLIEIIWYGEIGKHQIDYYFNYGRLIFAFEQEFNYNRPIYWDKKRAKENGDDEAFDSDKTTVKEDRYYFNNGKLFLWLDNEKKEKNITNGDNSIVGKELIAQCYKLKNKLKIK